MNVQLITSPLCFVKRCECNGNLLYVLAKLNYDNKKLRATIEPIKSTIIIINKIVSVRYTR